GGQGSPCGVSVHDIFTWGGGPPSTMLSGGPPPSTGTGPPPVPPLPPPPLPPLPPPPLSPFGPLGWVKKPHDPHTRTAALMLATIRANLRRRCTIAVRGSRMTT